MRVWTVVLAFVLAFSVTAFAGEYYLSDYPNYWWYWDGEPDFEVLIPATAYAYVQQEWAGASTLKVALGEDGPMMVIGTMPGTNANTLWNALSGRWAPMAQRTQTTTDSTITTDQGLQARFKVLEGRTSGKPTAIVRTVIFTKDGRMAYLAFIGNESEFSGDVRQFWLRAVHSFNWRP